VFGQLVGDEGLQNLMVEHMKIEPDMRLYLRADRSVKFAIVKRAMTACAAAGVQDVLFATYEHDITME
jgi:biopolymer transport protein ExbD